MSSVKSLSEQTRTACRLVCLLSTLKRYWQCWDRPSLEEAETESTGSRTSTPMEPVPWGAPLKQNLWTAYIHGQFFTLPAYTLRMWVPYNADKLFLATLVKKSLLNWVQTQNGSGVSYFPKVYLSLTLLPPADQIRATKKPYHILAGRAAHFFFSMRT